MQSQLWKIILLDQFKRIFIVNLDSFEVLKYVYSSRQYGKRRYLFQQRKQRFQDRFINKAVQSFTETAGGDDFTVAYGNGSCPLTMKGMYGGDSAHNQLMMLLSKRVCIVMTNECSTTKGCPTCMDNSLSMKCLKGNPISKNRKEYCHHHKASCYKTHDGFY